MSHTPEPWFINEFGIIATPHDTLLLVGVSTPMTGGDRIDTANANARRIVACVNACAGLPDGSLEYGSVLDTLLKDRNDLLAALKCAEEWLQGWASAEPYLGVISAAITKAEAA